MICGDQIMDRNFSSPSKTGNGNNSINSSTSSSSFEVKPLRCSWAEEVLRENVALPSSHNSSIDSKESPSDKSQDREISLEFIEGVNEEKFERLLKEDKLKTPFKRRHSATPSDGSGSRSNSPNSSNSDGGATGECVADNKNIVRQRNYNMHKEEKRVRHNSYTSSASSSSSYTENDPSILLRRQKQIDYGKNTVAYERYVESVERSARTRNHPQTPNKYGKYSRRAFDGLIKIWRKQLHYYDPPNEKSGNAKTEATSSDDSDSD